MSAPISPDAIASAKQASLPDEVLDAFNELIVAGASNGRACVKQNEVVALILAKMPDVKRAQVFELGWLEVEAVYRKAGWKVEYDKPGFNESYEAFWIFTQKGSLVPARGAK